MTEEILSHIRRQRHATKCGAEWICGTDQNDDTLQINRAYLWISDCCSVTVRVRARVSVGIRVSIN